MSWSLAYTGTISLFNSSHRLGLLTSTPTPPQTVDYVTAAVHGDLRVFMVGRGDEGAVGGVVEEVCGRVEVS